MKHRLLRVASVVVMGCLGLSACGDGSASSTDSQISESANAAVGWNDADVTFVQGMIPHHEQAMMMSNMMTGRTVSEATVELAQQIGAAQSDEVLMMQGFLAEWGVELDSHAGHSGDHSMGEGMMSDEQLDDLDNADGVAFERMWLTMMLEHHKGAIVMANAVMADGAEPRVRALAEAIITAQEAEIAQIEGLLAGLGN